MKWTFVRNINNMGEDGIVDIENQTMLCICHEEQSKIILSALSAPPPSTSEVVGKQEGLRDVHLKHLKRLQEEHGISKDKFQQGYYNGFSDGCDAIIKALSTPPTPSGQ